MPWKRIRPLLHEVWYVEQEDSVRIERLVRRHIEFGRSPEAVREWALTNDQRNAELVSTTRDRADLIISVDRRRAVR